MEYSPTFIPTHGEHHKTFHGILSIPHNTVMDMSNVMSPTLAPRIILKGSCEALPCVAPKACTCCRCRFLYCLLYFVFCNFSLEFIKLWFEQPLHTRRLCMCWGSLHLDLLALVVAKPILVGPLQHQSLCFDVVPGLTFSVSYKNHVQPGYNNYLGGIILVTRNWMTHSIR